MLQELLWPEPPGRQAQEDPQAASGQRPRLDAVEPETQLRSELSGVLAHELAHALIRKNSNDRAPGWLHEGLAQWLEGRRIPRSEFRRLLGGGRHADLLSALDVRFRRASEVASARAHYAEALGLVEFLVAERGEGAVSCVIEDLAAGITLEDSLRQEAQMSELQFVSRFKTWAGL